MSQGIRQSMAPSAVIVGGVTPPSKRQKMSPAKACAYTGTHTTPNLEEDHPPISVAISPHPLQIKPSGNAYTSASNLRDTSTGLFAVCSDELIIELLGYLDAEGLTLLEATSKGLYAFSRHEELWKALFIEYVQFFPGNCTPGLSPHDTKPTILRFILPLFM